ncbi:MAG: flagellin [Rhizobiaceae bacterium]
MTSINTNPSAMTALRSLQATNKELQKVQNRISTGFRVGEAADNAAYWSIATTMRSDNKALSTVQDALGLGASKIDVNYTALNSTKDVVDEIKSKLVAAREGGVDRSKIQAEILHLQDQLRAAAGAASFSGENWLSVDSSAAGYSTTQSIVSSFTRNSNGVTVQTIDIDITSTKLYDANDQSGLLDSTFTTTGAGAVSVSVDTLDVADPNLDDADIDDMISNVDAVLLSVTTAASDMGAAKKRVSLQQDFVSSLIDAIDRGIGTLVDADMNKESTRLQALQVQQQLGIQSLTIANANAQAILSLFQ